MELGGQEENGEGKGGNFGEGVYLAIDLILCLAFSPGRSKGGDGRLGFGGYEL